jgi:hypothetical protein
MRPKHQDGYYRYRITEGLIGVIGRSPSASPPHTAIARAIARSRPNSQICLTIPRAIPRILRTTPARFRLSRAPTSADTDESGMQNDTPQDPQPLRISSPSISRKGKGPDNGAQPERGMLPNVLTVIHCCLYRGRVRPLSSPCLFGDTTTSSRISRNSLRNIESNIKRH